MELDLVQLLAHSESEHVEKKSALDPTNIEDILGLIADLVAMANTQGGIILVGSEGQPILSAHLPLLDSARLDDKINSYSDPRVGGIKSTFLGTDFVAIGIEKSKNPPHVFKKDGNYQHERKGQLCVFRSGDIYVRHSSKTERATRSDLDRMLGERQRHLLEKVKMVFEAPSDARIHIEKEAPLAVRVNANAAGAQPVYEVLTPEPFRNLEQELMGGVKAWKTSRHLLNEAQIVKAYKQRNDVTDLDVLNLLTQSCWEHRLPGYYWSMRLPQGRLFATLEETIKLDLYPSTAEALKVASLLPKELSRSLLALADTSTKSSVKNLQRKLEAVLRARTRKHVALAHILYPGKNIKYKVRGVVYEAKLEALNEENFEEILGILPDQIRENRSPFRLAELISYGQQFSEVETGVAVAPEAAAAAEAGDTLPFESSKPAQEE